MKYYGLLGTIVLALSLSAHPATAGPFDQGTEKITLTDAERANLLQYVNQSKAALEIRTIDAHLNAQQNATDSADQRLRELR